MIDATQATAWGTAELQATASIVLAAQHETDRAATERARALAIDPHSIAMLDWLSNSPQGVAR